MGLFDGAVDFGKDKIGGSLEDEKGFLFGNTHAIQNPTRNIVGLDSGTESLMNQREQLANRSPEQIAAEAQQGVQQDSGAAFRDQGLMAQGQGGAGNPFSSAIQNRQSRNYLRDVNSIKRQAEYQAPLEKQREMQQVMGDRISKANAAAGVADRDREQQLQDYQFQQNQIAARRQVISTIFGTAGAAVGAYLGGAQGAKAGNAAGKSMYGGSDQTDKNYA